MEDANRPAAAKRWRGRAVRLAGRPQGPADPRRVGLLVQAFSLYGELSVRQNLALHARLFHLPQAEHEARIEEMLERFALTVVADSLSGGLPLGIRQRLSLAVAVLHRPEILILDERSEARRV